ncbi:glycosyltransferase family 2 protein [Terriglobus saanensis]|uniref:Glycosyl transferase family 2 n=1 Tax=Terriglobus saanensis (strain ATCC BAA-1853 / DSM 23119 / SP1PR4) TaxID=401053 RepID=E8V3Z3_TERSS|nr:glycosyltransferase family A protein [Terriglobus saanensis]ADV81407.1 glycosyl transferase family 2 [Terriglobus saanensis SP1PR4]
MSIDVVIPAYNAEAFLAKALDSVLAQTVRPHQILVVDDGSTDATLSVVEKYGAAVRLLTQKNAGPSVARNRGVAESQSTFIAFLDADDWWHPTKLAEQLAEMEKDPHYVLCYTGLTEEHPDGTQTFPDVAKPSTILERLRFLNPAITPSCVMLRRSAYESVGGFNPEANGCEDWELWVRLRQLGTFCAVEAPLTNYRVSNTGVSSNADVLFRDFLRILDPALLAGLSGWNRRVWRRRILGFQNFKSALTARAAGETQKEVRYLRNSYLAWPSPFWPPRRFKVLLGTLRNDFRD